MCAQASCSVSFSNTSTFALSISGIPEPSLVEFVAPSCGTVTVLVSLPIVVVVAVVDVTVVVVVVVVVVVLVVVLVVVVE